MKLVNDYSSEQMITSSSLGNTSKLGKNIFDIRRLVIWSLLSGFFWLLVQISQPYGSWVGSLLTISLMAYCFALLLKRKLLSSLFLLIYLVSIQPVIRFYTSSLPYLIVEYFFIGWSIFVLLLFPQKKKSHWLPFFFYLVYLFMELLGLLAAEDIQNSRSIFTSSLTIGMALFVINFIEIPKIKFFTVCKYFFIGLVTILTLMAYRYWTNPDIQWQTRSMWLASGDMPPLHISLLLSLGIFLSITIIERGGILPKLFFVILAGVFFVGMILTFSRTGLYLLAVAFLVYFIFFHRLTFRSVITFLGLGLLGLFAFNLGSQIAGEVFLTRYADTEPTGRFNLVRYGWEIFLDHPILGVGTGNYTESVSSDEFLGYSSGAHNELIRSAAEHGVIGLVFWSLFALSTIVLGFSRSFSLNRGVRIALLSIFFLYLASNGIKIVIQPMILILAFSTEDF